ncbi:unnamed protein product [Prunus armeniaca]
MQKQSILPLPLSQPLCRCWDFNTLIGDWWRTIEKELWTEGGYRTRTDEQTNTWMESRILLSLHVDTTRVQLESVVLVGGATTRCGRQLKMLDFI